MRDKHISLCWGFSHWWILEITLNMAKTDQGDRVQGLHRFRRFRREPRGHDPRGGRAMWGARCDWGGAGGWETVWTESAACPGLEAACPPLALLGPHHQRPESLPLLLSALPEVVRFPTCQWQLFLFRQGPDRAVYARGIQKSTGLKTTTPESLNWWFLLLTSISLFVINHIMITIIILIIIGTSKPPLTC